MWDWADDDCEEGLWCACTQPTSFTEASSWTKTCSCTRPGPGVSCGDTLEQPVKRREPNACGDGLRCTRWGDSHWECTPVADASAEPLDASPD